MTPNPSLPPADILELVRELQKQPPNAHEFGGEGNTFYYLEYDVFHKVAQALTIAMEALEQVDDGYNRDAMKPDEEHGWMYAIPRLGLMKNANEALSRISSL